MRQLPQQSYPSPRRLPNRPAGAQTAPDAAAKLSVCLVASFFPKYAHWLLHALAGVLSSQPLSHLHPAVVAALRTIFTAPALKLPPATDAFVEGPLAQCLVRLTRGAECKVRNYPPPPGSCMQRCWEAAPVAWPHGCVFCLAEWRVLFAVIAAPALNIGDSTSCLAAAALNMGTLTSQRIHKW